MKQSKMKSEKEIRNKIKSIEEYRDSLDLKVLTYYNYQIAELEWAMKHTMPEMKKRIITLENSARCFRASSRGSYRKKIQLLKWVMQDNEI